MRLTKVSLRLTGAWHDPLHRPHAMMWVSHQTKTHLFEAGPNDTSYRVHPTAVRGNPTTHT